MHFAWKEASTWGNFFWFSILPFRDSVYLRVPSRTVLCFAFTHLSKTVPAPGVPRRKIQFFVILTSSERKSSPSNFILFSVLYHKVWGTLRYTPEGRGFDSRWGHWDFSLTSSFRPHYGPGVYSASDGNEYQGCLLGAKAAVLRADNFVTFLCYLEIPGASTSWSPKGLSRPVLGLLCLTCHKISWWNVEVHFFVPVFYVTLSLSWVICVFTLYCFWYCHVAVDITCYKQELNWIIINTTIVETMIIKQYITYFGSSIVTVSKRSVKINKIFVMSCKPYDVTMFCRIKNLENYCPANTERYMKKAKCEEFWLSPFRYLLLMVLLFRERWQYFI
jgi:hypothetical protein